MSASPPSPLSPPRHGSGWWRHAVIYEIYVRSFHDSNGDGVGDLNGVTERLDYLHELGVDALWLTPFFPSPMVDFGYDISDFCAIDSRFGTLDDFRRLVHEAEKRGMRVVIDLVLNHTSTQHPWFIESASSHQSIKRDWFIWHPGLPHSTSSYDSGGPPDPPNNWQALFGNSAWQFDCRTNEFYYHYFYPEQPDLNWRNPHVQSAMLDVLRFWVELGVAGFRLDALANLFERADLADAPLLPGINEFGDGHTDHAMQSFQPECHSVLRDVRAFTEQCAGDDVLLLGELYVDDMKELLTWYGQDDDELHLPMTAHIGITEALDAGLFRARLVNTYATFGQRLPLLVTDNHDRHRSWDRVAGGDGQYSLDIARCLATILLTLRASVLLYYGQEIGMATWRPEDVEQVRDPIGVKGWPGNRGRDGQRTPMQWDSSVNAGFTAAGVKPWLPIPASARQVNVECQRKAPHSLLSFYKELIVLRRQWRGPVVMIDHDADDTLVWLRLADCDPHPATANGITATVPVHSTATAPMVALCNLSTQPRVVSLEADLKPLGYGSYRLHSLITTLPDAAHDCDIQCVALQPYGVFVGQLVQVSGGDENQLMN